MKEEEKKAALASAEKELEATKTAVLLTFMDANPHANPNAMTDEAHYIKEGKQIQYTFEYSVVNAFGATAVHKLILVIDSESKEIIDETDELLHFKK